MASSRGHRDCVIVDLPGGGPAENTPGHGVDAVFDGAQVGVAEAGQLGALADVAADEAVAVLVRGALPRAMSVGEVDVDAATLSELGMAGHLAALVPGQRVAQHRWDWLAQFVQYLAGPGGRLHDARLGHPGSAARWVS